MKHVTVVTIYKAASFILYVYTAKTWHSSVVFWILPTLPLMLTTLAQFQLLTQEDLRCILLLPSLYGLQF